MKVDADLKQTLPSEPQVLKETPAALTTGNVHESSDEQLPEGRSAFRQGLSYIPGRGLACRMIMLGKSGVVELAQSNKLRSLKEKAVALCVNVHDKRDKLPLPVEYAFRHALCCVPGGGLACAATDVVMMLGSMGKSGVDQVAQSPDESSLREQLMELQTSMSELEKESDDDLKNLRTRVAQLEKESNALKNLQTRVSELEKESHALKNQLNLVMSMLKNQDRKCLVKDSRHLVKDEEPNLNSRSCTC